MLESNEQEVPCHVDQLSNDNIGESKNIAEHLETSDHASPADPSDIVPSLDGIKCENDAPDAPSQSNEATPDDENAKKGAYVVQIGESSQEQKDGPSYDAYVSFSGDGASPVPRHELSKQNFAASPNRVRYISRHYNMLPSVAMKPVRTSGSMLFSSLKYRREINMITKHHGSTNFTALDAKPYRAFYIVVMVLYAILLGLATSLDWYNLSKAWVWTIFGLRYLFTIIFAIDYGLNLSWRGFYSILERHELVFDAFLLLSECMSLVYLTFMASRYCASGVSQSTVCKSLMQQNRLSSCITMLRIYRIFMVCQPLSSLSKGIAMSIKSLMWTAVFVLLVIYACAIFTTWVFTEVKDETMLEFWGTLPRSMYTLFTILTLEGWNEVSKDTSVHYPYSKLFFVVFVCFATLTVMNVVTGIILDSFLTANEKLTGENACKGRCKRQLAVTRIISDALNNVKPAYSLESLSPRSGKSMSKKTGSFKQPQGSTSISMEATNAITGSFHERFQRLKLKRMAHRVGESLKNMASKVAKAFAYESEAEKGNEHSDLQLRRRDYQNGIRKSHSAAYRFATSSESARRMEIYGTGTHTGRTRNQGFSYKAPKNSGKKKTSNILRDLMDDNADIKPNSPSTSCFSSTQKARQEEGQSSRLIPNRYSKGFEFISEWHGAMYNTSIETERLLEASQTSGIIDMTDVEPYTLLSDLIIQKALGLAGIPMYQAYEVLQLYYTNGLYQLTVAEFVASCERLIGTASNRDMLSFELTMSRRLDNIDTALAQMEGKMETLMEAIAKIAH